MFVKAILQSLPTYMFSVFLLPRGIIDSMVAKIHNFWWENKNKRRGWAMLKWESVCTLKGMGGFGIKDLRMFNVALLGRQVWRFINNKETLCYKVFSAKYFVNGDFFSYKGFGWQIGNGRNVLLRNHRWGFEGLS